MIEIDGLTLPTPLSAPSGSIAGVLYTGSAELTFGGATLLGPADTLPDRPGDYVLNHTLSLADSVTKSYAVAKLLRLRRQGATFLVISHDEPLLESCADEIWWIGENGLIARGDPAEVLAQYRRHVSATLRQSGGENLPPMSPTLRQGDGRAKVESVELNSSVLSSGEAAVLKVTVSFAGRVTDPVIGIMIRTRIGLNVYGTNTELENLNPGPVEAGDNLTVEFRFDCNLCPGQYTITAASHDPDGVWHDWLEDAIAFAVTDSRYTAGVANLKAITSVSRSSQITAR